MSGRMFDTLGSAPGVHIALSSTSLFRVVLVHRVYNLGVPRATWRTPFECRAQPSSPHFRWMRVRPFSSGEILSRLVDVALTMGAR